MLYKSSKNLPSRSPHIYLGNKVTRNITKLFLHLYCLSGGHNKHTKNESEYNAHIDTNTPCIRKHTHEMPPLGAHNIFKSTPPQIVPQWAHETVYVFNVLSLNCRDFCLLASLCQRASVVLWLPVCMPIVLCCVCRCCA